MSKRIEDNNNLKKCKNKTFKNIKNSEYLEARELMTVLEYESFKNVINKAINAYKKSKINIKNYFADIEKIVDFGSLTNFFSSNLSSNESACLR